MPFFIPQKYGGLISLKVSRPANAFTNTFCQKGLDTRLTKPSTNETKNPAFTVNHSTTNHQVVQS